MQVLKEFTAKIPDYAVCYIEYGEDDNLTPEDVQNINEWLESLKESGFTSPTFSWGDDYGFTYAPEFGLPCNCVLCTVLQFK